MQANINRERYAETSWDGSTSRRSSKSNAKSHNQYPDGAGIVFGRQYKQRGFFNTIHEILFGEKPREWVTKPFEEDGMAAIFGGTGSGKSAGIVKPTLYRAGNTPFVAIDIKGDLCREYNQQEHHRQTKVFSLRNEAGNSYDPCDFIRNDDRRNLIANIQELVNALFPMPIGIKDTFWIDGERTLMTAALLYHFGLETDDEKLTFPEMIGSIMNTPPPTLVKRIIKSNNKMAKVFINNYIVEYVDQETAELIYKISPDNEKMLLNIGQGITNKLSIFASDPRVIDALTPNENSVKWEDLDTHNIFISVPEDRLEQYGSVVAMIITQLIRTLERRPEKHSSEGSKLKSVLLMLDEFPRLGKMEVITSAVSTLRSKKVNICLVMQSLAQLDAIYGEKIRRIILDNCSYKAILKVDDAESQKYFSDLTGTIPTVKKSRSTNYDTKNKETGYSESISINHEPLIRPHEFAALKDIVLITSDGVKRVEKTPYYEEPKPPRAGLFAKINSFASKIANGIRSWF
jgi:type IV secretion system protein VirD4